MFPRVQSRQMEPHFYAYKKYFLKKWLTGYTRLIFLIFSEKNLQSILIESTTENFQDYARTSSGSLLTGFSESKNLLDLAKEKSYQSSHHTVYCKFSGGTVESLCGDHIHRKPDHDTFIPRARFYFEIQVYKITMGFTYFLLFFNTKIGKYMINYSFFNLVSIQCPVLLPQTKLKGTKYVVIQRSHGFKLWISASRDILPRLQLCFFHD